GAPLTPTTRTAATTTECWRPRQTSRSWKSSGWITRVAFTSTSKPTIFLPKWHASRRWVQKWRAGCGVGWSWRRQPANVSASYGCNVRVSRRMPTAGINIDLPRFGDLAIVRPPPAEFGRLPAGSTYLSSPCGYPYVLRLLCVGLAWPGGWRQQG